MFTLLFGTKIALYIMVLIRAFERAPISLPLGALSLALIISGFYRNYCKYENHKVNMFTLHLDLCLASLFSLFTQNGSFDKFFLVYILEGIAILPNPYRIAYIIMAMAVGAGSIAFYDFKGSGQVEPPEVAQLLLLAFLMLLVFNERRQREQKVAFEKQSNELKYVNLQLEESMAWSERMASEAERRRIAGEIHDNLGHTLTGLILSLEAGKKLSANDPEDGKAYWDKSLQIARSAMGSVRELVATTYEPDLTFDLRASLMEMTRGVEDLTGLKVDVDIGGEDMGLSSKEQFNLYRIFQEALTNTIRHAQAERAWVVLSRDKNKIIFSYYDNGCGTAQIQEGNGLNGMIRRVSDIYGSIHFQSAEGSGFQIEICLDNRGGK